MAALIHDGDIAYLQSLYPELACVKPTPQQERALMYYLRGMSLLEASRAAGMGTSTPLRNYLALESTKVLMEHLRDREFNDVRITRDSITAMFFEAYHKSATAMEMIAATRELAKLHNMYPETRPSVNVNVNAAAGSNVEINAKKIERMSDEQLLALAPNLTTLLSPPVPIKDVVSEQ